MASSKLVVFSLTLLSIYTTVECHCRRHGDEGCYENDSSTATSTWNMWYIWISVVLTLLCCCGAMGYYCRQVRQGQARRSRQMFYTYPTDGVIQDPGIYYPPGVVPNVPVAPPAYDNLGSNTGDVTIQPGSQLGLVPGQGIAVMDSKPPAYAEVFGPSGKKKKSKV